MIYGQSPVLERAGEQQWLEPWIKSSAYLKVFQSAEMPEKGFRPTFAPASVLPTPLQA